MNLGQFKRSIDQNPDMILITNTIARSLPRGKSEEFQKAFDEVLGLAFRAGQHYPLHPQSKVHDDPAPANDPADADDPPVDDRLPSAEDVL